MVTQKISQSAKNSLKLSLALSSLFLLNFSSVHAAQNDGLVAHWSFDDCTAKDVSGNGHDGTINGKPQCVDGINNKTLDFKAGSYAEVPITTSALNSMETFTVSSYINIRDWDQGWFSIIDKRDANDSAADYGWTFQINQKDGLNFAATYAETWCNFVPEVNRWYFMSVVVSPKKSDFYVDGVKKCSSDFSGDPLLKTNAIKLSKKDR